MTIQGPFKLSQPRVDAALKSGLPGRHWDHIVPGLFLRVRRTDCGSYFIRAKVTGKLTHKSTTKEGKRTYRTDKAIGDAKLITLEMARKKALPLIQAATLEGIDPVVAARQAALEADAAKLRTFDGLADEWLAAPEKAHRPKTVQEHKHLLTKHIRPLLGDKLYADLTTKEVRQFVRDVKARTQKHRGPSAGIEESLRGNRTANRCHALVGDILKWAKVEGRISDNAADFDKMFSESAEKRPLMSDKVARDVWCALEDEKARHYAEATAIAIQLCFVTLQRPNEIASAAREDFDWAKNVWTIPPSKTKTKSAYTVHLSALAVELFKAVFRLSNSEWAFPRKDEEGSIKPIVLTHRFAGVRRRLIKAKTLKADVDLQLYDARRFGRTHLENRLGYSEAASEAAINHAPSRSINSRYNVHDYEADAAAALDAWASELLRIVN